MSLSERRQRLLEVLCLRIGINRHVVSHGIGLLGVGLSDRRCGPLEARFRGREGNVSGPR